MSRTNGKVVLVVEPTRRPMSRRRRLLEASQWRSRDIESIKDYVRAIERTIDRAPRGGWTF